MATQTYGDLPPRSAAYVSMDMLTRAIPYMVFEKFGQAKPIPANSTKTIQFRRWNALAAVPADRVLVEGVTPDGQSLTYTDVEATLIQYGARVTLSDVVLDTHEDPVMKETSAILGEQAAEVIERMRFGVLKAGTSVYYANGSARTDVNTPITIDLQRKVTRALKRQNAKYLTTVVKSSAAFNTENVSPSFVAICHPDLETDIRKLTGFIDVKDYGSATPWENEIGGCEGVRYLVTTICEPWADGGGAKAGSGTTMLSTSATLADVYPILFFAKDAYGLVPFKGKNAITPMVVNPKPSDSDPLGQRCHVSWKTMQTAVILNDAWMVRAEVACTA